MLLKDFASMLSMPVAGRSQCRLPLGVVPDDLDVDETAQVELLRPEHRHCGPIFRFEADGLKKMRRREVA